MGEGVPNRWVIAIAGTVVMVTIGCLYSWGLFTQPLLVAYGWDLRTTTWAYAIANFSLAAVGAVVYNLLVPRLAGFHAAALHAGGFLAARAAATAAGTRFDLQHLAATQSFTAADAAAVMQVFMASGVVFLPVESYSPSQIIAMPQFYLLWLQLFVNVIGGITIISNAVFMLTDLTRVSAAAIAPLFGLVSIFNALGRLFWGAVSDRIGCNKTFAAMFAVQAVTLFLLSDVHDLTLALIATSVVLFCCGGGFGTMPSFNAGCFGTKYMGLNYALILTAWGFAALVGPILVARAKDMTGSFSGLLPLIAMVLLGAVILPFLTKKPTRRPPPAESFRPSVYEALETPTGEFR